MTWREDWPGVPGTDREDSSDAEESSPFRVALKPSACDAAPTIASLRDENGEVVKFDARADAEKRLVAGVDGDGLRLQQPAPNDPTGVDAYLVAVPDEEPSPGERDPPAEGWTFPMRARQVGALAEALFGAYRWDPPPIVAYAARDLELEPAAFRVEVEDSPSSVGRFGRDDRSRDWVPDFEFVVRRASGGTDGTPLKRYVAEVKHGSTSFERDQRAQMERLARETGPSLAVLVIRVDLESVPGSYDLTIRALDPP